MEEKLKEAIEEKVIELKSILKNHVEIGRHLIEQKQILDQRIQESKSAAEIILGKILGLQELLKE